MVSDPWILQKLSNLADDFLHAEILCDNVHDARATRAGLAEPSCGNSDRVARIDKSIITLSMQSPFLGPAEVGAVVEGSVPYACPGQPELAYNGEKSSSRDRFRPC